VTTTITPLFTDAGLAAVASATGAGLAAEIAEIAIGDSGYAPGASSTALQSERARVSVSAGGTTGPHEVLVEAMVPEGAPEFWIREVGFFLADGTLLALWSDPEKNLGWRGELAPWFFKFLLGWTSLPANAITVTFDGDAGQAALSLDLAQVEAKLVHAVEDSGQDWDDGDNTQLTAAITAKVSNAFSTAFNGQDFATALAAYLADGGYLRRDVADTLTVGFATTAVPLVPASGTITPDLAAGNVFTLAVDQALTLAAPANAADRAGMMMIAATQNTTGGHVLTLAAGYRVTRGAWDLEPGGVNILYLTLDGSGVVDVAITQRGAA